MQIFVVLGFDEKWLRDFSGHNATAGRGRTCASGSAIFLVGVGRLGLAGLIPATLASAGILSQI